MKKKCYIIICLFASVVFSCEKDSGPYIIETVKPTQTISFSKEIQPIFDSSCIKCHNETHPSLNLKTCCSWEKLRTNYVEIDNPPNSLLIKRITGEISPRMPLDGPPYLTQTETDKILQWIEEGAKNN